MEQKQIANFFDIKTAQFDSIIQKKKSLLKIRRTRKALYRSGT